MFSGKCPLVISNLYSGLQSKNGVHWQSQLFILVCRLKTHARMNIRCREPVVLQHRQSLYVLGGESAGDLKGFQEYRVLTDSWISLDPPNVSPATCSQLFGKIFLQRSGRKTYSRKIIFSCCQEWFLVPYIGKITKSFL